MIVVGNMLSCELVTFISTFSCCLAKGKSIEEIALLSSILVLIGDNLDAIAAQEALCLSIEDAKRNKIQKEVEHNLCKDV